MLNLSKFKIPNWFTKFDKYHFSLYEKDNGDDCCSSANASYMVWEIASLSEIDKQLHLIVWLDFDKINNRGIFLYE